MLTIQIRRAHLVILAAVLFVPLCLGGALAGVVVGRGLAGANAAPVHSAPQQAPAYNPRQYDTLLPSAAPFPQLGPSQAEQCEQQWREYQRQYTDYQTGKGGALGGTRPRQPYC